MSRRLAASADLREILEAIIDAMRDVLDAERATVFVHEPATHELLATVAHGSDMQTIRVPDTAGLAGECARTRRIIRVDDAYADARFNPEVDRRTGFRTRSILAIPLVDHDQQLVGVAQVLNKRAGMFTADDEHLADALAAHAAVALRRGRLIEDRFMRLKLERELEVARLIQQSSFPAEIPQAPGFDIAAWNQPATQTGGDAYDIASSADGRHIVLLMADATGHGVGPALSVTQLRSMLRMAVRLDADLASIAQHANAQLANDLPAGRFITAWLGELDADTRTLRSLSAGQGPLLVARSDGRIERLAADTVPLGVAPRLPNDAARPITLQRGDVFAALSDGILEARNRDGQMLGLERVERLLREAVAARSPAAAIIQHLQDQLDALGRAADDDRTAIIIRAM